AVGADGRLIVAHLHRAGGGAGEAEGPAAVNVGVEHFAQAAGVRYERSWRAVRHKGDPGAGAVDRRRADAARGRLRDLGKGHLAGRTDSGQEHFAVIVRVVRVQRVQV